MKHHIPPVRLLVARLRGAFLALALTLPLTLHSQVDLYIAGDVVLSGINDTLYAQGNVIYNAGAGKLNQVPNSAFYFTGNFLNNNLTQLPFYVDLNPLLRSRGAVIADQGFPQVVGGVGKINFYSLQISKVLNTQKVDLTNQVTMFNKLKMVKGDLNVGSASIIFNSKDTASTIVNETDINRIYGTTGYLQIKQFLNSTLRSPARLGLTFNNLQDSVLVRRFFASQATAADGGIERYYEVRNSNGSVVGAFGESVYLDSTEINGHGQEANLRLFRSTDNGATWNVVTSTLDSNLNKVTAPNIQGITTDTVRYTIADFACANPPIDSLGADTSFCNGDSLLLNAGAGAGFTYLWSTGATTQTVWVFNTDTLWVQIENNRGCITRDTIVVTENGLPFVSLVLGQDTVTACPATPLGLDAGNAGANFLWSTSDTTQLISITHADTMLSYDTLWVVVTDSNGCANNDSIIFEKSPAPVVNLGGTRNICGGTNAVLNTALSGASGNVGPTFLWNTGASLPSITVGITGQYDVTVTNSYGCQSADTVQVNVAPSISLSAAGTNVTCNGLGNGAVTLTVGGGTPGFTYLWNNGTTTQNLSNVGPGTYNVTVTDALGCTANASTAITQPAALTQSISGTNVTCNGAADGTATFTVGGGSPGYTYLWSNGATTSAITNLGPGTYTVTATDANGCTVSNSRTITEPPVLTISLANQQNIGCNGGTNGQVDIAVTGGTTAYTYLWSNSATTQDIAGVAAGTYGVTVTDAHGCLANASFTLTEPSALVLSETHLDATCNGAATGSIDLTVVGGTPGFSYQWSNAATTQDLSAIGAGNYSVTVTDGNGCTATLGAIIAEPTPMVVTATTYNAACGQSDGAAVANVTGGTPGYTYNWPTLGSTLDSVANIPAGIYQVFVTDANGCQDSVSATVNNSGAPTVSLVSTNNASCTGSANGTVTVATTGGVAPLTFLWSNGDTTLAITGLAAGTYNLTVTAFDGCQAFFSQLITEPAALTASGIVTDASCAGLTDGAIDYIPGGGVLPYSFLWNTAATTEDLAAIASGSYSVILTDGNGCFRNDTFVVAEPVTMTATHTATDVSCGGGSDGSINLTVSGGTPNYTFSWSSGQISEDLSGLPAGTYVVTITDQSGCTLLNSATILEPAPIVLSLDSTDVQCNGGSDGAIDLTVAGGTTPFTYLWSNGGTTEDLNALAPGSYAVTVTDALGCTANAGSSINEPVLLTMTLSATDVHCGGNANGTASAVVAGGTGSYLYNWSNADTTASLTGLAAGNYDLTVTDDNGCTVTGSITVIEPPTLTFAATIVDVTCQDQTDGSILTTSFGGSLPYSYAWNNGATTPNLVGVGAGEYILTLTDSAGCTFVDTLTVDQGDSSLQGRFLMASVVNSEDTVYFLEFSTPIPTVIDWDFGDGATDSISYPWHVYADVPNVDTSYYDVQLAVANAWCTDTVVKTIKVVNGSGKINQGPGQNGVGDILNVAVYPNPNMGTFQVDILLRKDMDAKVQVIDLQGRLVNQRNLTGDDNYKVEFVLDNKVAAGVYLVNIQVKESQKIVRIVKF
jgi:hypothetical protein